MADEVITSLQNPKLKRLLALQQRSAERRQAGLFVVEGRRELAHCIAAGYEVDTLFVCPEINGSLEAVNADNGLSDGSIEAFIADNGLSDGSIEAFIADNGLSGVRRFNVSRTAYERAAYRGSTEGVMAEVKARHLTLSDLPTGPKGLLMVVERVEKPGNLGAILRSADAARADAVIVCDPLTDLYNPNLIRSSIGAVFTVPTVLTTTVECITFLQQRGYAILTAQLQDSSLYYDTDMRGATAIVMGTEATGLTDAWRQAATAHIRIPMLGRLDSLNVSVSAAILLFEAVRQRMQS